MGNNKTTKTGIARLLEISAQKPWHLLFAVIFSSISGILQFVPYFSAFKVIEIAAVNHGALNESHIILIMKWVIAGVVCIGGGFVFMYAGSLCSHTAAFKILYGLRMNLAKKLTELPLGFHSENSTGKIRKILELNVEKTEEWIAHALPDYISGITGFFVILILLFRVNIWLTLVFLVVVFVGIFIASKYSAGEQGMEKVRRYQNSLERINASAVQYVNGMPAVKIFNRTAETFQTFKKDIYDYQDFAIEHTKDFRPIYTLLLSLIKGIALFILPAGTLLLALNPSSLTYALSICMFLILAPGIVAPIFRVVGIGSVVKHIAGGVERIDMIFNTPPLSEPKTSTLPKTYGVCFSDVRFSYNPKDENQVFAVDGVSFNATEGAITALVGPSGGGKSTIAQLIPRFWDIEEGEIRIGSVNIKQIGMEDLNTIVSFVFQDCFLFFDSIRENIRGGKTGATEEEIISAAKAAQCHDFITALPNGYDTLIGEGGIYLSGGEEQRINIARAILKNTPVLVLDEATAFADSENEALLYRAIKSLIQNKTVIMIAHRLSTIVNADKIMVIDNGKILEEGTHHSLVEAGGLYTELYEAYTKSAEWTVSEGSK
jgi:ATP-binding cassette subfamily B protein